MPKLDEKLLDAVFELAGIICKFAAIAEKGLIVVAEQGRECVSVSLTEGFP